MLLGVLLLALAAVALVVGSALLGDGVAAIVPGATGRQVRSVVVGLAGALATTVVAVARNQTAVGSGVPFGAAMFVLAAAFGAGALLGRRRMVVDDPILYAAPAAGVVLAALSVASDRSFSRGAGGLLAIVFVPYLLWVLLDPGRAPNDGVDGRPEEAEFPWGGRATESSADPQGDSRAQSQGEPPARSQAGSRADSGADPRVESRANTPPGPALSTPGAGNAVTRAVAGAIVVTGAAFALVEGTVRVGIRAHLAPGFAGATLAGSLVALPFALLVLFPRAVRQDEDPGTATMTTLAGLMTLVPGVAALIRPFELDGPAAACLLAAAVLYGVTATWMLLRGRSDRLLGVVTLLVYVACLVVAGSL